MASSTSLDSAVGDWRISFIFAVPDLNRSVRDDEASFNLSIWVCFDCVCVCGGQKP